MLSMSLGRLARAQQCLRVRNLGRCFSSPLPDIDANELTITQTTSPKPKLPADQLKFGHTFTDHMFEVDWNNERGWHDPRIEPYHNLSINPAASSLHYALQCFEGMKAYIDPKTGQLRVFRPDQNAKRMNYSGERLFLPNFDEEQFLECLYSLLRLDKDWVPTQEGFSLYIRPTLISTHPFLGVGPAQSAKLFVICSPVGPYYPQGFSAVRLYADAQLVRAWPGGTGDIKCGGNYAAGILPQMKVAKEGYAQLLWLFGDDLQVTEVGTMNQFFFWVNEEGEKELITAPLDGTILSGITRRSILELTRSWDEFKVTERKYTLKEIMKSVEEGRMIEAFGSGTAAVVSPVKGFHFDGNDYDIPLDPTDSAKQLGPLTERVYQTLTGIQVGGISHPWSIALD